MDACRNIACRISNHMQRGFTDTAAVVIKAFAILGLGEDDAFRVINRSGARQASAGEEVLIKALERPSFPINSKTAD